MIVPRNPKREMFVIGRLDFTVNDETDRVYAWVEIGNRAKVVTARTPLEATERATTIIRELSGENGSLFFRQIDPETVFNWEVGV